MKYSKKRRIPEGIPPEIVEESLKTIVTLYGEKWLNKDNGNPLQTLWHRDDVIATNELFIFGNSLNKLDLNSKWVVDNVKKISVDDPNTQIGAVFEIMSAALLKNDVQKIIFTKKDNPGYDLSVKFNDNSLINVSIKNFGLSQKNKLFNRHTDEFKRYFLEECKRMGITNIRCIVEYSIFPENNHWTYVKDAITNSLKKYYPHFLKSKHFIIKEKETANIFLSKIPGTFSNEEVTHELFITAPYHKNERRRLYTKILDACDNLEDANIEQDEDNINIILIHVPETASLDQCEQWAKDFFADYPDKPVSGIIFVQDVVVKNLDSNKIYIQIGTKFIKNDHYKHWHSKNTSCRELKLNLEGVGGVGGSIPSARFMREEKVIDKINLDKNYVYQRGRYYKEVSTTSTKVESSLKVIYPGIYELLIVHFEDGSILLAPKAPEHDKLILI